MVGRIVVTRLGGPEVLSFVDEPLAAPGPGEALVRQSAIGVNFLDVYFRSGAYAGPPPPFGLGSEAAGVVEAIGEGVNDVKVGDRVAYALSPFGAYAEARLVPAERLVVVPDGIDERTAAAILLKGMTAEYLLTRTYVAKRGDTVVVHAAAGGVGLILCQWAKHLGVTVIGTVSTDEKAEVAKANGCEYPIVTARDNFVDRVRAITDGRGVPVVYDSIGRDTFAGSLDCLAPRGMLVLFGQSSGRVEPVDLQLLSAKGSLYVTRPTLGHYAGTRAELVESAKKLFEVVKGGAVKVKIATYPLREAARAHADLEARKTTGSVVLVT